MPLTFGIPLAIAIILAGGMLLAFTRYKKVALMIIGFGGIIFLLFLVLIILVLNSPM